MKILLLSNASRNLYGFRKELIYELLKCHSVYIGAPLDLYAEKLEKMGTKLINLPLDRRGKNPVHDFDLFRRYNKEIKRVHPDLVITYTIKPNIYGGIVCRKDKIKYAANITGLGTAFQKQDILKKMVMFLYKIALCKAKVVFFENFANECFFVSSHIVRKEQTCLLHGAGVNLEEYRYKPYPKDNDIFIFLFIGRIMKEKGVNELFEAMKLLIEDGQHCILDIVGECEENYRPIMKCYEKAGWLKYYGYQNDVVPFIERAHCFVLPSWHEGMANTNLECAASGRPLITSNIPGCKEAVIEGVTGLLCDAKNRESLYRTMKRMITIDWDDRRKMGIEGRKHVEKFFDKKKVVEKTLSNLL